MKKILCVIIACMTLLTGCQSTLQFQIEDAYSISITSGNTGKTIRLTNVNDKKTITEQMNSITFKKIKTSDDYSGWNYRIIWYNNNKDVIEEIIVNDEMTICYKKNVYVSTNNKIDIQLFEELLTQHRCKIDE